MEKIYFYAISPKPDSRISLECLEKAVHENGDFDERKDDRFIFSHTIPPVSVEGRVVGIDKKLYDALGVKKQQVDVYFIGQGTRN
jgi:hypothetical protein